MEYTADPSDYPAIGPPDHSAPHSASRAAAADPFNKLAALAYARWEALRDGTRLPSLSRGDRSEPRLFTHNCVQVAWDRGLATPTISYLGQDLAEQFASLAGDAWPNLPIESPLVTLLHDVSRRALQEQEATEFDEQITDSGGWIRDYRGLALPFSGDEPGTLLVHMMFDLDNPIPADLIPAGPKQAADPGDEAADILLLEQELDPEEMPRLAKIAPAPPVLFLCVGDEGKRPAFRHQSPRAEIGTAAALASPAGSLSAAPERSPEPLLLTEGLEVPPGTGTAAAPDRPSAPGGTDRLMLSLDTARDHAAAASGSEERSHLALYKAIGAAYDFARCAEDMPERLEAVLEEAGLKVQSRAPMTAIVKLIFGSDYDRSRLAEYAAALAHAFRVGLQTGSLAGYLLAFEGGLKGVVKAERELKRKSGPAAESPLEKMEAKLRELAIYAPDGFEAGGHEFTLLITRRMPDGSLAVVGEVPRDDRLLCSATRRFLKR